MKAQLSDIYCGRQARTLGVDEDPPPKGEDLTGLGKAKLSAEPVSQSVQTPGCGGTAES